MATARRLQYEQLTHCYRCLAGARQLSGVGCCLLSVGSWLQVLNKQLRDNVYNSLHLLPSLLSLRHCQRTLSTTITTVPNCTLYELIIWRWNHFISFQFFEYSFARCSRWIVIFIRYNLRFFVWYYLRQYNNNTYIIVINITAYKTIYTSETQRKC